ncbi:MAG: DNA alkylation repair protein [Treponemataceae bacterium]|nr:DNA alkylation repair protein [Treponemataceae bacterium]
MTGQEITDYLFSLQDIKYRDFQSNLIPVEKEAQDESDNLKAPATLKKAQSSQKRESSLSSRGRTSESGKSPAESRKHTVSGAGQKPRPNQNQEKAKLIGVRTPLLRALAKKLVREAEQNEPAQKELETFLSQLPHQYFEEKQLHAFIISLEKDFEKASRRVEAFLPYVDNWATCDQLIPLAFKTNHEALLPLIKKWLSSKHTYTVRFAIGMLLQHFLDKDFSVEYLEMVAAIRSDQYYINMMTAWYFATALAKQYEAPLPFMEQQQLAPWTHNKTIQKSVESYRIPAEHKEKLISLRLKLR